MSNAEFQGDRSRDRAPGTLLNVNLAPMSHHLHPHHNYSNPKPRQGVEPQTERSQQPGSDSRFQSDGMRRRDHWKDKIMHKENVDARLDNELAKGYLLQVKGHGPSEGSEAASQSEDALRTRPGNQIHANPAHQLQLADSKSDRTEPNDAVNNLFRMTKKYPNYVKQWVALAEQLRRPNQPIQTFATEGRKRKAPEQGQGDIVEESLPIHNKYVPGFRHSQRVAVTKNLGRWLRQ
ncbi:hypothetical protein T439DRAFT_383378 [Meredithblackwellia eburnea MCA 4105]